MLLDLLGPLVFKVLQALLGHKVPLELQAQPDQQAHRAIKDLQV